MTLFEQELRTMFDSSDMIQDSVFVGKTMLGKLDDTLRVKLQFVQGRIKDEYEAIQATILNRTEGIIDKETFRFSDIIGTQETQIGNQNPHIWIYNGKAEWYKPITVQQKAEIADTILSYVEMYLSSDMTMGGPNL